MNEIKNKYPEWNNWLRENAEKHFIEGRRRYAWQGVTGAHDPRSTLSKQVYLYYDNLPAEQKTLFRRGIVDCLLKLPQQKKYLEIFQVFIQLAIECNCYEIVESGFFEKMVFRGKLGHLNNQQDNRDNSACIYYSVINALRHFSSLGNGKEIVLLANKMVRSPFFPKKHVYLLFLILCKAQPNKLFNHWKTVRYIHFSFIEELKIKALKPSSHFVLISELSKILDLEQIQHLQNSIKLLNDYRPEDEWLLHVLHKGPLEMHVVPKKNAIELAYSDSKEVSKYESTYKHKGFGQGFFDVLAGKNPDILTLLKKNRLPASQIVHLYNVYIFNLKPKKEYKIVKDISSEILAPILGNKEVFLIKGLLL